MSVAQQAPLSRQIVPTELPGARKAIPPRALWISLAALGVAMIGAFSSPEILAGYDALSWLLILIPAFLLAFYRGWQATARVLGAGMLIVLAAQLLAEHVYAVTVDWIFLFWISVVLLAVGLGLAVLSELLQRERRQALVLAYTDRLTGLPNRRLLDFMMAKEFAASKRGRPLTLVLFAIDGFEVYRARYGRRAGDDAIRQISACLDRQMRQMNIGGRFDDSQFLAILSGEKVDGAWVFADRTRQAIGRLKIVPGGRLTVSVGIAPYEWWMRESDELIESVTRAIRRATAAGGDCVISEPQEEEYQELPEDISELSLEDQLAAEEALRRQALEDAEIRYRSLFDGVPVGIYRTSPEGEVLDANWAMVKMFGYPDREGLLAANASEFYADAADRDRWHALLEREKELRDYELHLRRYDGTTFWARTSARIVQGRGGRIRFYEGSLADITERKRADAELRSANEKLQALFDSAPIAVMVLDTMGRVQTWNAAAQQIFGWSEEEAVGQRLPFLSADSEGEFQQLFDRTLDGETLMGLEVRRQRRDNSPIDLSLFAAPLYGTDQRVNGVLGMMVDVTERRELEHRLAQSQKMESVGQLAGGIAHDFNNLLTAILGNCEITLGDLPAEDPRRSGIEDIRTAAVHAAALTRQLLAFSRRQILQPRVLNLNAAVRETLEMLRRLIGEDIELVTELDPDLGNTRADPVEVGQVIMNLSVNARDAMPDGGRLTIRTTNLDLERDAPGHDDAIEPGRWVVLSIADSGTGMDEHTRERIFEPFFTTKEKGKGTGLGLSTVYGIVKQSGGHIALDSRPGIGTTFKIYLPTVEEAVEGASDEPLQAVSTSAGTETILLVEDEASLRAPISKLLGRQGYSVLVARDGREALEICNEHDGRIDLMVTDLVMPGMSGLELGERVAAVWPDMKILYTSGYSDAAMGNDRVLAAGLEFIQKPYSPSELGQKIRELLDR